MRVFSNKLLFLICSMFLISLSGGLFACAQSNNLSDKRDFTKIDFEKLRWLEGNWRGTDASGENPFFERYRFVGNDKIETDSFSDSTMTKVDNQSSTFFENGAIIHKSGSMIWTAAKVDSSLIEFSPKDTAPNSFVWEKQSADAWTARLIGKDTQGKPTETIYLMTRIKQ